jgi:hypothetical protein
MDKTLLDQLEATIGDSARDCYVIHPGIRRLLAALLVRALRDLDSPAKLERYEAMDWIFSRERKYVFSAYYSSYALGLELTALQDFVLYNWPESRERTTLRPRTDALPFNKSLLSKGRD